VRRRVAVEDVVALLDDVAVLQMERLALRDEVLDRLELDAKWDVPRNNRLRGGWGVVVPGHINHLRIDATIQHGTFALVPSDRAKSGRTGLIAQT